MAMLIAIIVLGLPARCVTVPQNMEWQVFLGNLWNVRGIEYMDANHVHIRDTTPTACTAETVGGWGHSFGAAEVIGGQVAIPTAFVGPMVLETYIDGVRQSVTVVGGLACQTACGLGDFDGDCDVDLEDYAMFQGQFGQ